MDGLETVVMNTKLADKLCVFQLKGLRKIANMTTTHVNRANANVAVFTAINNELKRTHSKPIIQLTEYHKQRRIKHLAQLICEGDNEPGTGVTFDSQTLRPIDRGKLWFGQPKKIGIKQRSTTYG